MPGGHRGSGRIFNLLTELRVILGYANYGSDTHVFFDHGVLIALIGMPTRDTHRATEMIEESDIIATVNLLRAFATTPPAH